MRGAAPGCHLVVMMSGLALPRRGPTGTSTKIVLSEAFAGTAAPMEPNQSLDAQETVRLVCTGLEFNDWPAIDAGMERLFNFLTPQGRVAVAPPPPIKGTQGGVTLEYFLEHAGSPAIGALIECSGFSLVGEPTITPATVAHGSLATQMVEVYNEEEDIEISHVLQFNEVEIESVRKALISGEALPAFVSESSSVPTRTRFLLMLEQQRRPPYTDCWLIKELHSMQRTTLQVLNEGGEEFEGPDTE